MRLYLDNSNIFANFEAWIGGSCKPSDKGKLTAFPRFKNCQQKSINVSSMLRFEDLPEINSPRWLSLEDLEGEEWRDVVGYEDRLSVSNYGRIKRKSIIVATPNGKIYHLKEMIYKQRTRKWLHQVVNASIDMNKTKGFLVHRAVAKAFIPNPNNLPLINHKDENPRNNMVNNIEWCTALYNSNYGLCRNKIKQSKIDNGIAKSVSLYDYDGHLIKCYGSEHEVVNELGISRCAIQRCCSGESATARGLHLRFSSDKYAKRDLSKQEKYYVVENKDKRMISTFKRLEVETKLDLFYTKLYINNRKCKGKINVSIIEISPSCVLIKLRHGPKFVFEYLNT